MVCTSPGYTFIFVSISWVYAILAKLNVVARLLFSAILAAFLIEIRKGLQENLLLQVLYELRGSFDRQPFQPTSVSV